MLIDKLCMVLGLTLLNGAVLNEQQRAIDTNGYEIINATNKSFILYNVNADEEQEFDAKTRDIFNYTIDKASRWSLSIRKEDYPTKPTNFYYIYRASDFEDPITITFTGEDQTYWQGYFDGYDPSTGLQIGQYESLLGKTYYLNNQSITETATTNIVGEQRDINILDGYSAKLEKKDGSYTQTLSSLTARVIKAPTGYINYVTIMAQINGQTKTIASNIDPKTMNNSDFKTQPYLIYWSDFTNKLVFQSGNKTVVYGDMNGRDPYYFTTSNTGYMAEEGDFTENGDGWTALKAGIDLVRKSFDVVSSFFAWVIFPGITLGLLLLYPILLAMFIWLIKLIKKG